MFRPVPRASGYLRTGYGQDLTLLQTRAERISLVAISADPRRLSFHRVAFCARSGLPGLPCLGRRVVADAAHRLCRTDLARPCRPDRCRRLHDRDSRARNPRAVLDHVTGLGRDRNRARLRVRTAVASAARALSRGQHAGAAFRRHLSRWRIRDQARLLDRHPCRAAESCRIQAERRPVLVFHAAGGRGRHPAHLHQSAAQPLAAAPSARCMRAKRSPKRSASASPATSCSPS